MTKNYESLQELKNDSLAIKKPIMVEHFEGEEEMLDPEYAAKFNGFYEANNSTLAFVSESILYVTPYTIAAMKCLTENGFTNSCFYVPFSNGDYPVEERVRWKSLRDHAKEEKHEEFIESCLSYSDENGFGELPEEILSKCFKIPVSGVKVRKSNFYETYYPVINNDCLDCVAEQEVGTYNSNMGKVVFVYRDGETYVAKGYKIVSLLQQAGYMHMKLFVPFSNGEEILDSNLAAQWEALPKQQ